MLEGAPGTLELLVQLVAVRVWGAGLREPSREHLSLQSKQLSVCHSCTLLVQHRIHSEAQKQVNPGHVATVNGLPCGTQAFIQKYGMALALPWGVILAGLSDLMNINEHSVNHIHHSPF